MKEDSAQSKFWATTIVLLFPSSKYSKKDEVEENNDRIVSNPSVFLEAMEYKDENGELNYLGFAGSKDKCILLHFAGSEIKTSYLRFAVSEDKGRLTKRKTQLDHIHRSGFSRGVGATIRVHIFLTSI